MDLNIMKIAGGQTHSKGFAGERRQKMILVVCAALAFGGKAALSFTTYGTNDVLFWEANVALLSGGTTHEDGSITDI
jgi:hypothetical protein